MKFELLSFAILQWTIEFQSLDREYNSPEFLTYLVHIYNFLTYIIRHGRNLQLERPGPTLFDESFEMIPQVVSVSLKYRLYPNKQGEGRP